MSDPLLIDVTTHESSGTYWAVLQRWVKQACINASISIPMSDPLLRDLTTYDSEGTRFAVLQRWLTLLADNLSGGGGGGIVWVTPPATSTSPGTAGQVAYDSQYFYAATGTNQWTRTALSDW